MEFIKENKHVSIIPNTSALNGEALVNSRSNKLSTIKVTNTSGQKYVTPPLDESKSKRKLDKLYDDMHQRLSKPRVQVTEDCGVAIFNATEKTIEVVRKVNDMSRFGYMSFGQQYLHYYEALFLLEMGRLQIDYHSLPLSVEQAYVLLLNESACLEVSIFLVYKHLSGLGFYLAAYKDNCRKSTDIDYAWLIVQHQIQGTVIPEAIRQDNAFKNTLQEMLTLKNQLLHTTADMSLSNLESPNMESEAHESFLSISKKSSSIIDYLEQDDEYMKLKASFSAFNYVDVHKNTCHNGAVKNSLNIIFDIFFSIPNKERRPALRLGIIKHNELFPTAQEILQEYEEQINTTPLLFCHVGTSKQIQAYLYHL